MKSIRIILSVLFLSGLYPVTFSVSAQELASPFNLGPAESISSSSLRTNPLRTAWGRKLLPENVHPDYPRPTLVRKDWLNLNGFWDWKADIRPPALPDAVSDTIPSAAGYEARVLVPFPIESSLSGIGRHVDRMVYRRLFSIPEHWPKGHRIILHFGAVDWEATVYVNGRLLGRHRGGYDSFSFDITDYLKPGEAEINELAVQVFDPTDQNQQVRGKQAVNPSGIWYTSVSGIWQTVWLEPVSSNSIQSIHCSPNYDNGALTIWSQIDGGTGSELALFVEAFDGETIVAKAYGGIDGPLILRFPKEKLKPWSPDSPFLYQLRIRLLDKEKPVDQVGSYVAFRKIDLVKNALGKTRIRLNERVLFQMGVLDQGYWPDGFYTAPSDAAIQTDIRMIKKLGFNMVRKHVKIEPERWYFWCDRLGLLVWQDMPNGDNRTPESQILFRDELQRLIHARRQHPSIVAWTIFNEGWGQHRTEEYVDLIRHWDSTRLINNASGWMDCGLGDVNDHHKFPGPQAPRPDSARAAVIGSFGGLTLVPPGDHLWTPNTWGYQHVRDSESLIRTYRSMHDELRNLIRNEGLSAAVFHQLTDVESECNGLMSYDRALLKIPVEVFEKINAETIRFGSSAPVVTAPE